MFGPSCRGSALALALSALLATACAAQPSVAPPDASPTGAASLPVVPAATPLSISVTDAKYGLLSVRSVPGARCQGSLRIGVGAYGDAPPDTLPATSAGADGFVTWSYPTPRVPSGTAGYAVQCQHDAVSAEKAGNFTIPTRPIVASSLTVRVTTESPPGVQVNPDPSLVPLRDSSLARIKATLATEWNSATRGMGSLRVEEQSTDITIFVIAARGTSVHRTSLGDDSQDILIYASDELNERFGNTVENKVATALHELGHIWCCQGPDATAGGHWVSQEPSPGLYGVDKYGLMNEKVLCTPFGTTLSCPNRFSDREMVALGFTNFPPPAPDPCITQSLALKSQIATLESQIKSQKTQIQADEAAMANLLAEVRAIETQYPGGIPEPTYSRYLSLRSQYSSLYAQYSQRFDQYSAAVDRGNGLIAQLNGLPCDSS